MPEIIRGIEQGDEAWIKLRLGSVGGTGINSILSDGKKKGEPSIMRKDLLYALASEKLTGVQSKHFFGKAMSRGHEYEDEARQYFAFIAGIEVETVTMILSDTPGAHYSPDGLIGTDGILEAKIREPELFLKLLEGDAKPPVSDYRQCQMGLWVSKRNYVAYIQYCPEYAVVGLNPIIKEIITADAGIQDQISERLPVFLKELSEMVERRRGVK